MNDAYQCSDCKKIMVEVGRTALVTSPEIRKKTPWLTGKMIADMDDGHLVNSIRYLRRKAKEVLQNPSITNDELDVLIVAHDKRHLHLLGEAYDRRLDIETFNAKITAADLRCIIEASKKTMGTLPARRRHINI